MPVALLDWYGKWYGRVSLLLLHDLLSGHHRPHIFFVSAAEFPGPSYKEILICNLLWFGVDSHSSYRKYCAYTRIHVCKVVSIHFYEDIKIIIVLKYI